MTLSGQTFAVTGAASGIGRALTLQLLNRGAIVHALDIDGAALTKLGDEGSRIGSQVVTHEVDVLDNAAIDAALEDITRTSAIDGWVNNAGIAIIGEFHKQPAAEFQKVLEINLHAVIHGTRSALSKMEEQGFGSIVNIASMAGHIAPPLLSAYAASKHGVVGFTRSLQEELRLRGSPIHMLLVSPGFVDTDIIAKGSHLGFPEWLGFILSKPEAVANDICRALSSRRIQEIFPTLNGKLLRRMHQIMPRTTARSAKALLAKTWKDFLLNRYYLD